MRRALLGLALAALAVGGGVPAFGDRVVPKKGPPLRGTVIRTDTEVIVNRFRSKTPAMTYGVVRLPADQVKRIDEEVVPDEVVRTKHAALAPDDVAGRVGLARYALSQKSKAEAGLLLEEALALAPENAEALDLYGGKAAWEAARRGNPSLDPALRKDLAAWLAIEDKATRARDARRLATTYGYAARPEVMERAWKSQREPKGLREDVPLTLRSDKSPGAVFTVFVPETYDPLVPTPLVLALHGGGTGGKDGKAVVGNGRDAARLYLGAATRLGWILVCPTALQAPWAAPPNEPFLMSLLEEVEARWNVDLDRVYLTGHSMGGFGTWWLGPRHVDLFACVAPTAGGGGGAAKPFRDARTGIFVYHSADDPVVGVASDQQAAAALLEAGDDVVYLQLEDRGHSFPPEAEAEMFDMFVSHRLHDPHRTSAWPRSSFARKPSADEAHYLGDPTAAWGTAPESPETLKRLVDEIERGGGGAEKAAETLASTKPEGAAKAVAKVLRAAAATDDARAWAARCLGGLGDETAVPALAETVSEVRPGRVVREVALALERLASPAAAASIAKAASLWVRAFEKHVGSRGDADRVDYVDWEEHASTLAALVAAYGACGPSTGLPVVRGVETSLLRPGLAVDALARAGQDASRPRALLARALARAYAALGAPDAAFAALASAVKGDPAALAAVEEGRAEPVHRRAP